MFERDWLLLVCRGTKGVFSSASQTTGMHGNACTVDHWEWIKHGDKVDMDSVSLHMHLNLKKYGLSIYFHDKKRRADACGGST